MSYEVRKLWIYYEHYFLVTVLLNEVMFYNYVLYSYEVMMYVMDLVKVP